MTIKRRRFFLLASGVLLAASLSLSACSGSQEEESTASAAAVDRALESSQEETALERSQAPEETTASDSSLQIIGGADGPTSVFVVGKSDLTTVDGALNYYILQQNEETTPGDIRVEAHQLLKQEDQDGATVCYVYFCCQSYDFQSDEELPAAPAQETAALARLRLRLNQDQKYILDNYWLPGDGSQDRVVKDVQDQFPEEIQDPALRASVLYTQALQDSCRNQAESQAGILSSLMKSQETTAAFLAPQTQAETEAGQ